MTTFEERAKRFGHSTDNLNKGVEVTTSHTINDIDELRSLMDGHQTSAGRDAHMAGFSATQSEALQDASADIAKLHTRAAAAIFGSHQLSHDDTQLLRSNFPMTVNVTSAKDKVISSEWDLGTEGPPVVYNIGTLTINPGGSIKATATAVTMTCQSVVNNASGGSGAGYTIGVFGVNGATGAAGGAGGAGTNGDNGASAGTPSPGVCTGARTPVAGGVGQPGAEGGSGQQGENGQPNLPASFTFHSVSGGPIIVSTVSGGGGSGGAGGAGGRGGDGGRGGNGCQSGCEGTASANGGNGGNGGKGGSGGTGGNAANGQPINVLLGKGIDTSVIVPSSQLAHPGAGGAYGAGGAGGSGGSGGSGSGKHRSGGSPGTPGSPGQNGTNGSQGSLTGQPGQISVSNLAS